VTFTGQGRTMMLANPPPGSTSAARINIRRAAELVNFSTVIHNGAELIRATEVDPRGGCSTARRIFNRTAHFQPLGGS